MGRYEKRRTLLLSQYLGPQQADQLQTQLRLANPSPARDDGSRSASLAALSGPAQPPPTLELPPEDAPYNPPPPNNGNPGAQQYMAYPPSQVGRFQERQLGLRTNSLQRRPSYGSETFIPRPGTPGETHTYSRDGTMVGSMGGSLVGSNFAFNPDTQAGYDGAFPSPGGEGPSRQSTMLDAHQGYFSDFTGQQMDDNRDSYGGPNRYSSGDAFSPTAAIPRP